jgi:hypothetical protein
MNTARRLIDKAKAHGVRLYVRDGDVRVVYRGEPPADLLARLRAAKGQIEAALHRTEALDPRINSCQCGAVGIHGVGWSWRDPDAARWYCPTCLPAKGEA